MNHSLLRVITRHALLIGIFCYLHSSAKAQWSLSDALNNIHNTNTGFVGIGTTTPTAALEVAPNGSSMLVHIGTTGNRTNTTLQVLGSTASVASDNASIGETSAVAWNFFNNNNQPSWAGTILRHWGTAMTGTEGGLPQSNLGELSFQNVNNGVIASNGAPIFISPLNNIAATFLTNGNVLIGATTQVNSTYKLEVNGSMRAQKVVVNTTGADFVFDKKYRIPTLAEVEAYIQQYRHLPGIRSAAEMQRDGMDVGDNQTLLLQKVEELTLYIIEQNKKMKEQEERISRLEQTLENERGRR